MRAIENHELTLVTGGMGPDDRPPTTLGILQVTPLPTNHGWESVIKSPWVTEPIQSAVNLTDSLVKIAAGVADQLIALSRAANGVMYTDVPMNIAISDAYWSAKKAELDSKVEQTTGTKVEQTTGNRPN
jgi:hypothetical protein